MSNKIEIFRGFASSNFSCALEVEVWFVTNINNESYNKFSYYPI